MWKVYKITTKDGKIYIGRTSREMKTRMSDHKHKKMKFYDQEHVIEIVLTTTSYAKSKSLEAELIKKYDSTNPKLGYNRLLCSRSRRGYSRVHKFSNGIPPAYVGTKFNFKKEFTKLRITRSEFLIKASMSAHTLNKIIKDNGKGVRYFSFDRAILILNKFKKEKLRYDRINGKQR